MIDYNVDITPLLTPVNWANIAELDPKKKEQKPSMAWTGLSTRGPDNFDFFAAVTGPSAPTTALSARATSTATNTQTLNEFAGVAPRPNTTAQLDADVERVAKQRVQLMAAKYAKGTGSSELVARLEILNRRLLEKAPRVSKAQVVALEDANEQLARIRAAREDRARRLGIQG